MPNRIPEFQISHFLSAHTVPLALASLPSNSPQDQRCPICHNPYTCPSADHVHPLYPPGPLEYAVQIHDRGACAHIFGRRCIESHIRSGKPWSHTCPICRAQWFPAPNRARTAVLEEVESARNGLARMDLHDEVLRVEVEAVDRALERIREVLYGQRWI